MRLGALIVANVPVINPRAVTFLVLGLVSSVVPGGPGPQNPGLERPDAQRRGRIDPASPPPGYYETRDRQTLRQQVREALTAIKSALTRRRST